RLSQKLALFSGGSPYSFGAHRQGHGPSLPARAVNSVASSATSIWVLAIRAAPLVSCLLDSRAARPSLAGCTVRRPFESLRCLAHHGQQQPGLGMGA
ncbi:hypothetical protein CH063_14778, partial [Colletotrichum higginsianum]